MAEKEFQFVTLEIKDRVATITINRPDVSNAIDHDTLVDIHEAFKFCGESEDVGVIVFTGAGKNFCAGGNLKKFKDILDSGDYIHAENVAYAGEAAWDIRNNPKPTIAMINGAAAGMGAALAAACDFRVFDAGAKFVMAFVNVGLSGDTGCMFYLTKLVGIAKAMEIMMTGEPVTAEEALRIGLATRIARDGMSLKETTYKLAKKFAQGSSFAYQSQKQVFNSIFYTERDAYTKLECKLLEECSKRPDFKEAVDAFVEKRKPVFGKKAKAQKG